MKEVQELRELVQNLRAAVTRLEEAGLKRKTVVVLMAHHTKLPQKTIVQVIDGFETLEEEYFSEAT